jgi:hypothetical protein
VKTIIEINNVIIKIWKIWIIWKKIVGNMEEKYVE